LSGERTSRTIAWVNGPKTIGFGTTSGGFTVVRAVKIERSWPVPDPTPDPAGSDNGDVEDFPEDEFVMEDTGFRLDPMHVVGVALGGGLLITVVALVATMRKKVEQ